jgi:hypothetical protein
VNLRQLRELVEAVGACLPKGETAALEKALESAPEGGYWELGWRAGEPWAAVKLRWRGAEGGWKLWAASARAPFSAGKSAPAPGRPWWEGTWDLERGSWAKPAAGDEGSWSSRRFSPSVFGDAALEEALAAFAAQHEPGALWLEKKGARATGRWALELSRRPAWPLFARCDLAARFSADSSQLALFSRDLRVGELAFDADAVWAFCGA